MYMHIYVLQVCIYIYTYIHCIYIYTNESVQYKLKTDRTGKKKLTLASLDIIWAQLKKVPP